MTQETRCQTFPDDDAPASEDRFGAHQRIARTMAQIIDTTPGGKTIGLSGVWGSGKSTVVRLLAQCYTPPQATTIVWTFDAWAHEGDPLRRTFLDRLVTRLAAQGWLTSTAWQRDLDIVARRRKWSRRRQAPRLTPIGVLVAVCLLFVPIGSALFTNQIRNGISLDPSGSVDWVAVLGLVMMLSPLLVPVLAGLLSVVASRGEPGVSGGRRLLDALSVFVLRGDTDLDTDTLESGDQTTPEFARLFGDIMRATLGKDSRRRLVIVIDNLDRVGAGQALAIWSTLQTFVHGGAGDGWSGQLWYLIPFDADAIRRLWQKDGPGTAVAESFLDKTFQLRFEVPLPRLANWKDYLTDRLAHVLPRHAGSDEFFRIYRLYSLRRSAGWMAPTPRQLKLFVNQIGSLHWQRGHTIPLPDLAYYVLLQSAHVDIVEELVAGRLPAPGEASLLSDRVRHHLAALVYGADVEESHELLLRQPVLDALEAGDSDRLGELAHVSDQFWLVLELAVEQGCQEWTQSEGGLVLHAAAALDGSTVVSLERSRAAALMTRLRAAARATSVWGAMDARAIDGAIVLARQDRELAGLLHESFTRTRLGDGRLAPETSAAFAHDYARLATSLAVGPSTAWRIADATTYIEIAKTLAGADPDGTTWGHFAPQDAGAFVAALMEPPLRAGWDNVVRVAVNAGVEQWDAVVAKAGEVLGDETEVPASRRLEFLTAVQALAGAGNTAADTLLNSVTDAYAAAANYARDQDRSLPLALAAVVGDSPPTEITAPADPDGLGAWLFTLLTRHNSSIALRQTRSSFSPALEQARLWLDQQYWSWGSGLAAILARATLRLGNAHQLLKLARQDSMFRAPADQAMVLQVLTALADLAAPPRVLPPSVLGNDWDMAFPGWSRYSLARAMRSKRREVADWLVQSPFEPRLASAYAGVLDAHPSGDETLQSFCAAGIGSVPADTWSDALRRSDDGLPLLHAALTRRGGGVALSPAVKSALREFITAPPDVQWMPPDVAAALMAVFAEAERKDIVDTIVDDLVGEAERLSMNGSLEYPTGALSRSAWVRAMFAGRALFDPERLSLRPYLFPPLAELALGQAEDAWVLWLHELVRALPVVVERLPPEARTALSKSLRRRLERASGDARSALVAMAGELDKPPQRGASKLQST